MLNRIILIVFQSLFFVFVGKAQLSSPVGIWILKSHTISTSTKNQNIQIEIDSNLITNNQRITIEFKSNSRFIQEINDKTLTGKWKVKNNQKTLILKYDNKSKIKIRNSSPINFYESIELIESLTELYDGLFNKPEIGFSIYERINSNITALNNYKLSGNWIITHKQIGNKKEHFETPWWLEINFENYTSPLISANCWKTSDSSLLNYDLLIIKQPWHPYQTKLYIEKIENEALVISAYINNKVVLFFLKKINENQH